MRKTRIGARVDEDHCVLVEKNQPDEVRKISIVSSRGEMGEYVIDLRCLATLTDENPVISVSTGCAVRMPLGDLTEDCGTLPKTNLSSHYFPRLSVHIDKAKATMGDLQEKELFQYGAGPIFGYENVNAKLSDAEDDWARMRLLSERFELFSSFVVGRCMIRESEGVVNVMLGIRAKFSGLTTGTSRYHIGTAMFHDEGLGVYYVIESGDDPARIPHISNATRRGVDAIYISQDGYKGPDQSTKEPRGPTGRKSLYAAIAAPREYKIR